MEESQKIKVGITQGDTNGISFEIIMKAFAEPESYELFTPIIYGSPKAAAYHRKALNIQNFSFNNIHEASEAHPKRVNIVTYDDENIKVELGNPTQSSGEAALESLTMAASALKNNEIDILVMNPVDIKSMQNDNFRFVSQSDYLQSLENAPETLTMFISDHARIGIVADNISVANIPQYITKERIISKLRLLNESLKKDFSIRRPRIAVLGLNPHAGEGGLLGNEEEEIIYPAVEATSAENIYAFGPYSADSIFGSDALKNFDAVLAMYTDQGLTPFKSIEPNCGVTYTAGLSVIATSPIHGNGFDIAGQNKADYQSFNDAIYTAIDIRRNRLINAEISQNPLQVRADNEQEKNA